MAQRRANIARRNSFSLSSATIRAPRRRLSPSVSARTTPSSSPSSCGASGHPPERASEPPPPPCGRSPSPASGGGNPPLRSGAGDHAKHGGGGSAMTAVALPEFRAALRKDFHAFLMRCFAELHAGQIFSPAWHAEVLAAKLQGVREGDVKRLVVNVPPRHLKSLAASVALPAWLLGHDPALAVVNVTYAQDLSEKFARDCRAVMTAPWYRSAFSTKLASPREPLAELVTTRGGFRLATSVGGVLTGRGADVILIDDLLKPIDALSESRGTAANDWSDSTLYSRLNDKAKGAIVIVMQRLHEDDLAGHVLKQEGWELVSFPAVAEDDELHVVETRLGRKEFRRLAGDALDPERESLAILDRIRATIGEANFASQYQQRPAPAGGGMVKTAWFRRYADEERPQKFDRIIQSWDTANKSSELADYSVCT